MGFLDSKEKKTGFYATIIFHLVVLIIFLLTAIHGVVSEETSFVLDFSKLEELEEIAKQFYADKYYISHLFKEQVGVTLWNYVIFRRLTAFNDLIRANTPIEDACFRVGFQNYSNFFRLYKKHMQMTPREFKQSVGKTPH